MRTSLLSEKQPLASSSSPLTTSGGDGRLDYTAATTVLWALSVPLQGMFTPPPATYAGRERIELMR